MRKIISVCLLAVLLLASCATTNVNVLAKDENGYEILIPLSKETAEKRELLRAGHSDDDLKEEAYPALIASLLERDNGPQEFPEVETKAQLDKFQINNEDVYTLGNNDAENIVLYIHGGAYAFGIDSLHVAFCDKLVTELNAKVYMPLYPLTPQNTYEPAHKMMASLYKYLLSLNKPIYIMGDSAGGGFSLALVETAKKEGWKLPDKMVLLSPWVDVTLTNPEIPDLEEVDLTISAYGAAQLGKLWAGELDTRNPIISPLFGDVSDLCPTLIICGTDEIPNPDNVLLYNKMKDAGNKVSIIYGEGLWHVFVVSAIKEAEICLGYIKDFCLQ